jgi:hypothetical protein
VVRTHDKVLFVKSLHWLNIVIIWYYLGCATSLSVHYESTILESAEVIPPYLCINNGVLYGTSLFNNCTVCTVLIYCIINNGKRLM